MKLKRLKASTYYGITKVCLSDDVEDLERKLEKYIDDLNDITLSREKIRNFGIRDSEENHKLKAENEKLKQELKQEKKVQGCELAFHRTQYFKFVKDPSIVCNKCIYKYSPRDTACENCFCHDRKNEKIHFEFLHEMGG